MAGCYYVHRKKISNTVPKNSNLHEKSIIRLEWLEVEGNHVELGNEVI